MPILDGPVLKENFVDLHYLLETAQLIEQGLLCKGLSKVTADNCVTPNCLYQERAALSVTAFASHSASQLSADKGRKDCMWSVWLEANSVL